MIETVWVLDRAYGFPAHEIAIAIERWGGLAYVELVTCSATEFYV